MSSANLSPNGLCPVPFVRLVRGQLHVPCASGAGAAVVRPPVVGRVLWTFLCLPERCRTQRSLHPFQKKRDLVPNRRRPSQFRRREGLRPAKIQCRRRNKRDHEKYDGAAPAEANIQMRTPFTLIHFYHMSNDLHALRQKGRVAARRGGRHTQANIRHDSFAQPLRSNRQHN